MSGGPRIFRWLLVQLRLLTARSPPATAAGLEGIQTVNTLARSAHVAYLEQFRWGEEALSAHSVTRAARQSTAERGNPSVLMRAHAGAAAQRACRAAWGRAAAAEGSAASATEWASPLPTGRLLSVQSVHGRD